MVATRFTPFLRSLVALALLPVPARALNQPNGTVIPTPLGCRNGQPDGLSAVFACACTTPNTCNIGAPCQSQNNCDPGNRGTCETTLFHAFSDNACVPSKSTGLDVTKEAKTTPETFRPTCPLTFTVQSRGTALFGNAFGWYNVRPGQPPDPNDLHVILKCDDKAGTVVTLDLSSQRGWKGGEIGFFLVTPEDHKNPWKCAANNCCGDVTRANNVMNPEGWIYYSQRDYNPDHVNNGASYIHLLIYDSHVAMRKFYFAWEDIFGGSNNDFTDLVTSVQGVECSGAGQPCDTGKKGVCGLGTTHCDAGMLTCVPLYTLAPERCDGLDNDCNGPIDDGAKCPGMNEVCWNGECVPHCTQSEFACALGYECDKASGLCIDPLCTNVMCPTDKICQSGKCVAPCEGLVCPRGTTCRLGNCINPCKGVTCPMNLVCAGGFCVPGCGRCDGITCTAPLTCDMPSGNCKDPSCPNGCPDGTWCDNGTCKDACLGATCPRGQVCTRGECVIPPPAPMPDAGPPKDFAMRAEDMSVDFTPMTHMAGCDCSVGGSRRNDWGVFVVVALGAAVARRRKKPATKKPAKSKPPKQPSGWSHFYRMIKRIPFGKVSTYGAIAEFTNRPRAGRHVGYALAALRSGKSDVPWHRVLGARSRTLAKVSIKDPMGGGLQRAMLEAEGVEFDQRGNVKLAEYGWTGPRRRKPREK